MRKGLFIHRIIPANLMPFRADLSIDEPSYRKHLRWLADAPGVAGIVVNGHAAEVSSLSREERKRALAVAHGEIGGRIPVVSGVYSDGTSEAIELARDAKAAGAAGVLYAIMFKQVHFFMGFIPGIKAFTAAVLGGIGNIPGAMIGGIFLGLIESVGPSLFLDGLGIVAPYQLKDAIAFTVLVLVLIFRPTGILGERLAVKKA